MCERSPFCEGGKYVSYVKQLQIFVFFFLVFVWGGRVCDHLSRLELGFGNGDKKLSLVTSLSDNVINSAISPAILLENSIKNG